ncbi:MAG TPA: hypothetical protein VLH08_22165 [Acidobacteriota bacterium]|nr:hypothetical protein [Acidobacteriota bacterium]
MIKKLKAFVLVLLIASPSFAMKFYADDPITIDNDQKPVPQPAVIEAGVLYDMVQNSFFHPGKQEKDQVKRAANINTLGEVPDSSWFTNRIGVRSMTKAELMQGSNQGSGPDPNGEWTIIQAKSQGVTPGFTIRDSKGDVFFLKFDPKKNPQLSTSAEVVGTRFFHAFGYNVPENYIALLHPDRLKIGAEAIITDENGQKLKMKHVDVDRILRRVPQNTDGTVQVIASRRIPGTLLGPFKYYGTRNDDANDIFQHEDRRELRGMYVFASWLNHDEPTRINTLDAYQGEPGKGYVKHYLIDFGSTLGSGSIEPNQRISGNEYVFEKGPIFKSAVTLGLADRDWRSFHYPEYPAVGRFESQYFEPGKWKPQYPNAAFGKMTPEDAFWATKIVMRFTDEMVHSLVEAGKYEDPGAVDYISRTLMERRDKIIQHYLSLLPPLDEFQLSADSLQFKDLGVERKVGTTQGYSYQWFRFDNNSEKLEPIGQRATASGTTITLPSETADYLMAQIQAVNPSIPQWNKPVDVYVNMSSHKIVGIERHLN